MRLDSRMRLLRWSMRKVQMGIPKDALVLDVGSGGNPHPRADVLLERYEDGRHRHGVSAVVDRPMVFGDACKMPFRDKAFDYVIAFHVLEHMRDPAAFLNELSRVARAGYIETPNVMFERIVPYDVHLLEIMEADGRLVIRKKPSVASDPFVRDLRIHQRNAGWQELVYGSPELFHVRHFWKDRVSFEVVNPEENCDWFVDEDDTTQPPADEVERTDWRGRALRLMGRVNRARRQINDVGVRKLLVCPNCRNELADAGQRLACKACGIAYGHTATPNFTVAHPL